MKAARPGNERELYASFYQKPQSTEAGLKRGLRKLRSLRSLRRPRLKPAPLVKTVL